MTTTTYYPYSACVVIALETDADKIKSLLELDAPYPPPLLGERRAAFVYAIEDHNKQVAEAEHRAMLEERLHAIRRKLNRAKRPMPADEVESLLAEFAEVKGELEKL